MHASVRRYRVRDIDALIEKVESEFVEQVKEIDGFVGYYVIHGGDNDVATVTVGETEEAIDQSAKMAAEEISETASDLVDGDPDVTSGEVRIRAERNS